MAWKPGRKEEPDRVQRQKSGLAGAVHRRDDGTFAWHAWSKDRLSKRFGLAPTQAKAEKASDKARAVLNARA